MNNNFRKVDAIDSDAFKEAFILATSYSKLLRLLGLGVSSKTISHAKERAASEGLDDSHFIFARRYRKNAGESRLVLDEDLDKRVATTTLRRNLLLSGVPQCCKNCGNTGTWNGKQLTLEIHHKNSNWKDNRLENLEFLCPNCHSQYTRNNREVGYVQFFGNCSCGKPLDNDESIYCSLACHGRTRTITDWGSIDLISMIDKEGMSRTEVSRKLGIRYNTIKKWYLKQKEAKDNKA